VAKPLAIQSQLCYTVEKRRPDMQKTTIHDIQGLYSETRQSMDVLYTYDAWGVPTFHNQIPIIGTSDLGKLTHVLTGMLYELTNQLTYRGYFYDFETGLYYLQSRYYAPNWGRFVNADKHFDTGTGLLGTNLYIYCDDNPIMKTDPNGEAEIIGTGATYTVYKASFYVTAKKSTYFYFKHTNNVEHQGGIAKSGENLEIIGGYSNMFAFKQCLAGSEQVVFINKSDVKPHKELGDSVYFIRNYETKKYMDVKGFGTGNNTPVIQYDYHGKKNQQWKLTYGSDGFYRLSPQHDNATDKALDITSASWAKTNNKELKIYTYQTAGVTQQKWIVADSNHGTDEGSRILRLIPKESVFGANDEKCLEIGSGNKSNSKPVQTWDADKNDASKKKQQWVFVKASTSGGFTPFDGVVTGTGTYMLSFRKSASTTAEVHGYLPDGTKVKVVGESGNFFKIQHGGKEGYGTKTYIEKVTSTTSSPPATNPPTTNPPSTTTASVVWPLAAYHGPSGWGWRLYGTVKFHNGIDIGTSGQMPKVLAIMAGKVHATGRFGDLGYYIILEHTINNVKYYSRYQHLSEFLVAKGTTVDAGQAIAKVGGTGSTDESYYKHLHFELSKSDALGSAGAINLIAMYSDRDTRESNPGINDQPLFVKSGSTYIHNANFAWNWSDNPLPAKYSHSTDYKK
jgi:RHS repeat-associated protein